MAKVNELMGLRPGSVVEYRGAEYIIRTVELEHGFTRNRVRVINRIGRVAFTANPADIKVVKRA